MKRFINEWKLKHAGMCLEREGNKQQIREQ